MPRLSFARARSARYLTDTCRIERGTGASDDAAGGATDATTTVATAPCAIVARDMRPAEIAAGAQLVGEMRWAVYFAAGTDVAAGDRIVVTTQGDRALEVIG